MKFLVFQHIDIEHPGIFRDFMRADGIAWDTVELDEGDPIPQLEGYDALISMGGPMDVFEEDAHPWIADEKVAIREAVAERDMPFLGVCLGHQPPRRSARRPGGDDGRARGRYYDRRPHRGRPGRSAARRARFDRDLPAMARPAR